MSGYTPIGFPREKLIVIPPPVVTKALRRPGTAHLVVTACGYFHEATAHGIVRERWDDQAIIIVCVGGKGWAKIGGESFDIVSGQMLVVPPHTKHSYGADSDNPWTLWWLHVMGPDIPELLRSSRITIDQPVRDIDDRFRVVRLIEEVVSALSTDYTASRMLEASGAAWHLLTLLSSRSSAPGGPEQLIDRALAYLRDHVTERVSVDDLAAMANLSPSHFAALFRKHVGSPILQYQTQLRMSLARELLDTTQLAVATVAERAGYSDAFYFSRQFKAIHGMTPRDYRALHKG